MNAMAENKNNPWLGLESYQENQIIYGRNEEIADLSQRVLNDVDTVLYGKSGIGKTSIVNAGVLPIARQHGYVPVVIRLDHSNKTPYVRQIRAAIARVVEIKEVVPVKNPAQPLLWELLHCNEFVSGGRRSRVLLIFDQFEEIFTLQSDLAAASAFFAELGDVLNDIMPKGLADEPSEPTAAAPVADSAAPQTVEGFASMSYIFADAAAKAQSAAPVRYVDDNDIHFIFALREDFLSDFEYFTAKIPSLRHHRFGLRPLNEEQAADIIVKPRPGLVTLEVAKLIIETVTGRTDFSLGDEPEIEVDAAVLSLFLSRIYEKMPQGATVITWQLVKEFGVDIIKDFYTEAVGDLTAHEVEILEDQLLTSSGRRNNVSRSDLRKLIPEEKIDNLVWNRKLLRTFNYGNDLRLEFIHDILCPIVKERREQREQLRLQEEERRRQEEEKQRAVAAEQRKREEVERKAAQEKARLEAEARTTRERNRRRTAAIVFSAAVLLLLVGGYFGFDYVYNEKVYDDYFASYETVKGWPVGVGEELTSDERATAPIYYKLSYKGRRHRGHYTDVEVMSSNRYLPDVCRIPSTEWADDDTADERAKDFNATLRSVKRIHFSASENDSLLSLEEYFGEDNASLMTISYFYISAQSAIAQYFTPKGGNMKIRANGLDRVRIGWDASGRTVSRTYYDAHEVQQELIAQKDVTGYLWDYIGADTVVRYAVNQFGMPTAKMCNTQTTVRGTDSTVVRYAMSTTTYQKDAPSANCADGYALEVRSGNTVSLTDESGTKRAVRTYQKDAHGNVVCIETSGNALFAFARREEMRYDDGHLVLRELLSSPGVPFEQGSAKIYKWQYAYDAKGTMCEETRVDCRKQTVYHHKLSTKAVAGGYLLSELLEEKVEADSLADANSLSYVLREDSCLAHRKVSQYFGKGRQPINHQYVLGTDTICLHRIVVDSLQGGKQLVQRLYVYSDGKVSANPLGTFRREETYGDDANLLSYTTTDSRGNVLKSMVYFYQGGKIMGRAARGIDGNAVRCDRWEEEGLLYYKLYYNKDEEANYSGLLPIDEWGHKSVLRLTDGYYSARRMNFKSLKAEVYTPSRKHLFDTEIFNTYNQLVFEEDRNLSAHEMAFVHVLSPASRLYNGGKGLTDGDRIVEFGSWRDGSPLSAFDALWQQALSREGTVKVSVLRPEVGGFRRLSFTLAVDAKEYHRIECHRVPLSLEEQAFLKKAAV